MLFGHGEGGGVRYADDRSVVRHPRVLRLGRPHGRPPGAGPVTALTFKAGIDDPARFKSSRNVAAHFGLTPKRYQSGEVDNPGHISRAGDADVRSALYIAAHSLLTRNAQWSSLKAWGIRLAKTRGHRRAVIAVARKLAVILHRM